MIAYAQEDPEFAELERRQAAIAALPWWVQRKHLRVLMSERLCPREEFDRWLALKREEFYGCGQEVTTTSNDALRAALERRDG